MKIEIDNAEIYEVIAQHAATKLVGDYSNAKASVKIRAKSTIVTFTEATDDNASDGGSGASGPELANRASDSEAEPS